MDPSLAVLLCTCERAEPLRQTLGDVLAQLPAAAEVVVVDQSADPEPVRSLVAEAGDPRIRLQRASPGLPAARNLALEASMAPIVLFLDDDVRLEPGCLRAHLEAYGDPRVGGVVGRIEERRVRPNSRRVANRVGWDGRIRTRLDGARRQPIDTLKGCNMSFRRRALERAGGFDPGFGGTAFLEDADASARVAEDGWQLWFEPAAAVVHLSAPSGGVRAEPAEHEWWRFHNTGRFLRRHRGMVGASTALLVFGAIALKRAVEWRRPGAVTALVAALGLGWARGHGRSED